MVLGYTRFCLRQEGRASQSNILIMHIKIEMMKKDKPSGEHATEQDKSIIQIRGALAILFIILALIVAIYILSTWTGPGTTTHAPRNQSFQQQNWTFSPLINQYHLTKVPTIVINCKYKFEGSNVDIGSALCTATNSSTFCSEFGKIPLIVLNFPECKSGNKTLIYAFHSPSCPYSSAQRDSLDSLMFEFSSQLDVQYICTPKADTAAQDINYLCPQEFAAGRYNQ